MNRSSQLLLCRSATVHFTYSFALATKECRVLEPLTLYVKNSIEPNATGLQPGPPPLRKSIRRHLSLKSYEGWKSLPISRGTFAGRPVKIDTLLRILPAGGVCTFSVKLAHDNDLLNSNEVLDLLRQADKRPQEYERSATPRLEIEGNSAYSLYQRFVEIVEEFCSLHELTWLDQDHLSKGDSQSPWVVTVLEVDGEAAEAFCGPGDAGDDPARAKMLRTRAFEPALAPLLFRSVAETLVLEPAYLQPPTPVGIPGIFNIFLDARLFVAVCRRSILCVTEDIGKAPADYFIPALLDACETIRARWNSLVMLNLQTDNILRDMARTFQMADRIKQRKRIAAFRLGLASYLEDPNLYVAAGDTLHKIQNHLAEVFRIEELKGTLTQKMELLDQIYGDLLELSWLEKK